MVTGDVTPSRPCRVTEGEGLAPRNVGTLGWEGGACGGTCFSNSEEAGCMHEMTGVTGGLATAHAHGTSLGMSLFSSFWGGLGHSRPLTQLWGGLGQRQPVSLLQMSLLAGGHQREEVSALTPSPQAKQTLTSKTQAGGPQPACEENRTG